MPYGRFELCIDVSRGSNGDYLCFVECRGGWEAITRWRFMLGDKPERPIENITGSAFADDRAAFVDFVHSFLECVLDSAFAETTLVARKKQRILLWIAERLGVTKRCAEYRRRLCKPRHADYERPAYVYVASALIVALAVTAWCW